jgi:protoporphyrinogen/coproporphyrinogen III oxidase
MRVMQTLSAPATALDEERHEVVVVGGGIAGLTAAWTLRHRDVVLLEASDRLGGRMRSEPYGEYWLNYGAHLFPAPGSLVDTLARELQLETVPVWGGMMGLSVGRKKLTSGRVESYPFRLPLSVTDRAAFALQGIKVQRTVRAYQRIAKAAPGESPEDVRRRVLAFGDDRTFGEFLGRMPAAVEGIFSTASHRATAELDELSEGCGIGLFALVWGGKKSLIARNLLGGTGRLPAAMGEQLGARVRTNAEVTAIEPDGDGHVVTWLDDGRWRRVRARHVIVAAWAPVAAKLLASIAPEASAALARMPYGAFLSVAVATKETGPMPWDGVYAMATPGRVFDMFTNQAHALRSPGARRPGGSLMLFAGARGAAELSSASDDVIAGRFVDDLAKLYPEAAGKVAEARVRRWPFGNVYSRPGRAALQPAIEGPLGPHRNIHLAGDYFAELGNLEMAARTGAAAAERVDASLGASADGSRYGVEAVR